MNRPSLSKRPAQSSSSPSKPSLESSVYAKLHDALALLPQRRSSPTKPTSSTQAIRKSPFSIFSSSRHKQSASSPAQLSSQQVGKPVPPQKPVPTTPPPVPPKSAPASRTVTPMALAAIPATVASTPLPSQSQPSQPSKSRPTIPFIRSSTLMQPTAASSARLRPAVSSPSPSSASTIRASTHTRTLSKSRPEPPSTPLSPTASSPSTSADGKTPTLISSRSRMSPSPTHELKASSPTLLSRPRPAHRTPTSPPPSAFPIKSAAIPPRSLPRKRSKTFPDPSDPAAPVPPPSQTASRSMNTANRIIEAFEPSPRMNDAPEPFSPRSKSTSPIPIRPPRPSQDTDFRLIPSSSRASASHRIVPSTSSIEAAASRPRPIASSLNDRSNAARGVAPLSTSAPNGRSSLDRGLPPPPRKAVSPTLTSTGAAAQKRRLARPILQPIQTTPITSKNVSTNAVKPPSPVTPDTQPSSPSPRTPAPYVDAMSASAYLTSDDETKPKRRPGLKNIFRRPMAQQQRPDSMISAATLTSAVSYSGTSAVAYSSPPRPQLPQKGPGTFGDVMEEDEMPMCSMQTRRGILRHGHPVADVPYPISFEEMVLQGEKHTHELLSTVCQQKAFHFTPMENFAKLKNILDLGCGRGIWLAEAAKECKHANLVGFDLVDVFMKPNELRNKHGLNESQMARIEFVQGNFFNTLPFPADHFDYIRLAFLELAIPEPKWVPLLKEAWRVLRPGGNLEVIIESQLFPTVWSYDKLPVQTALEEEFNAMLEKRNIPPPTNIGEKMYFDAHARVKTHQHVSIRIAPRSAGRSSLDGPASPRNFGSMRSMHSPWSSEPLMSSGMVSPPPFGRPSLDRSGSSLDVLPPAGQVVTSKTCTVPGIIIAPDTFIPVSEEMLYAYASHSALILNATRLASFSDKYPDASLDDYQEEWREHWERYWQYERTNRLRLGFRMNQFDDDDDIVPAAPSRGRWRWEKCDDDLERPLEIRRFRAWSLTKPMTSR